MLRAFYQKMKAKGFKSKVEKLDQLKVEFDDNSAEILPNKIR